MLGPFPSDFYTNLPGMFFLLIFVCPTSSCHFKNVSLNTRPFERSQPWTSRANKKTPRPSLTPASQTAQLKKLFLSPLLFFFFSLPVLFQESRDLTDLFTDLLSVEQGGKKRREGDRQKKHLQRCAVQLTTDGVEKAWVSSF